MLFTTGTSWVLVAVGLLVAIGAVVWGYVEKELFGPAKWLIVIGLVIFGVGAWSLVAALLA